MIFDSCNTDQLDFEAFSYESEHLYSPELAENMSMKENEIEKPE